jgi:FkbM family methyltransferase
MLKEQINHGIRVSAALALRHIPELSGRWQVADLVNRHFAPISQTLSTACVRMRMGHEMLVDLRSDTESRAYYLGDFDTEDIRSALRLIRPDSTVLDVGANIGFWSIPLARHLTGEGCLHAFEPVPSNCNRLAENVRRNSLESTIHIHQSGLSDQNRSLQISLREDFANGSETGNAAIVIDSDDLRFRCAEIRVNRLDDLFDSLGVGSIDFIKADIEGHEPKFLVGATNVVHRFRPILYLEINRPYYERQSGDPLAVFEDWLSVNSYCAALRKKGKWHLDAVHNCKPMDNVFFLPSEIGAECISSLNC